MRHQAFLANTNQQVQYWTHVFLLSFNTHFEVIFLWLKLFHRFKSGLQIQDFCLLIQDSQSKAGDWFLAYQDFLFYSLAFLDRNGYIGEAEQQWALESAGWMFSALLLVGCRSWGRINLLSVVCLPSRGSEICTQVHVHTSASTYLLRSDSSHHHMLCFVFSYVLLVIITVVVIAGCISEFIASRAVNHYMWYKFLLSYQLQIQIPISMKISVLSNKMILNTWDFLYFDNQWPKTHLKTKSLQFLDT